MPHEELICDKSKPYAEFDACYPLDVAAGQPWSLSEVFGRPMKGSCLATDFTGKRTESVCLNVPIEREVWIGGDAVENKSPSRKSRCYTLHETNSFEINLPQQSIKSIARSQPPLYASRSLTGHGQERGGVQTLLTNPSAKSPIDFIYFETLPWFMKPYLHTLTARISTNATPDPSIIKSMYYRPALDRRRGTQLECLISVPPASTVVLTYDFDKAILRYTEYPPDANRGFDVPPAIIRVLPPLKGDIEGVEFLRTTSLLLPLPTPDFSMPYNVIILTSTVMALAFGMVFNLLVRRFVGADEVENYDLRKISAKLRGRFLMIKDRLFGPGEKKVQ